MLSRSVFCLFVLGAVGVSSQLANASIITPGTYRLGNHPDGAARPPLYGFRLDELVNLTGGHDVFTFDFDHAGSAMFLDYDGTGIHIYGTSFGGLDVGSAYSATYSGFWNIDFTYGTVVGVPSDDDLWVTTPAHTNSGSINFITDTNINPTQVAAFVGPGSIPMVDETAAGYTFRLGDENNDLGHRGFNGISGWGWVTHGGGSHVYSSDWLFSLNPVPLPGGVLLAALGLLSGAATSKVRRRKNQSA